MRHPFSGAEPEAIRAALVEIGAKKVEEFPELLNKLVSLLRAKDPIHVLAVLAGYGLQVGVSAKGISEKPLIPNLEQHHLELLQALILTLPIEEWGNDPAMPGDVQQVIDTISDLGDAFHQRRYKAIEQELDLQARTVLGLQERLRLHTQIVRNWGYFSDVVQISTELYGSLDEEFRNKFGFGASDVITVARCVLSTFEQRANERFKLLRRVFRERKISRMIRRYYECYPDMKGSPEELLSVLPPSATPEDVGFMILAHADLALPELLTFNSEAVASQAGLAPELVAKILGALSLRPGALKGGNPEYFFLSNPVWQAPLIRMQEAFFVALPQCIFSHIHDVMRSLAEATELKAAVERRKSGIP